MAAVTGDAKERVRLVFNSRVGEWAACYSDAQADSLESQCLRSRQRIALEMLASAVPAPARVLDAGCGTGETAAKLLEQGYEARGMDISESMVSHACARLGADRFRVGDLERIPFPDSEFDAVVCLGVIEYLERDEGALREIARVLRPGGTAVISTPNAISPLRSLDALFLALENGARPIYRALKYGLRGGRAPRDPAVFLAPHRAYRRREWMRLLQSAELEPEDWICHGWGWYRSGLGSLAESMARTTKRIRVRLERGFGPRSIRRVHDGLLRCRPLNWMAAEQVVRVRAVK
jgi:ubiquinone/menaquinone biosynthesis C-methylase UbiE